MKVNNTSRSGRNKLSLYLSALVRFIQLIGSSAIPVLAEEQRGTDEAIEKMYTELSGEDAAASNPLAAVDNTDLKWTYIRVNDANDSRCNDYWIKGGWTFAS